MFIQTETTPNPLTLKFLPGVYVTGGQPVNLTNKAQCKNSPLAELLFDINNVTGVFLGYDFITITKTEEGQWDIMKPEILVTIMDYFTAGREVLITRETSSNLNDPEDSEIVREIKELIETRVRPSVAMDGGDIVFRGFKDGIVQLELHGSCSGCPSSSITLKNGIETMLKHYVPEVIAVEAV